MAVRLSPHLVIPLAYLGGAACFLAVYLWPQLVGIDRQPLGKPVS